jgi:hypothetical protein
MNKVTGNGTTTATVLVHAIYVKALKMLPLVTTRWTFVVGPGLPGCSGMCWCSLPPSPACHFAFAPLCPPSPSPMPLPLPLSCAHSHPISGAVSLTLSPLHCLLCHLHHHLLCCLPLLCLLSHAIPLFSALSGTLSLSLLFGEPNVFTSSPMCHMLKPMARTFSKAPLSLSLHLGSLSALLPFTPSPSHLAVDCSLFFIDLVVQPRSSSLL